MSPAPCTLRPHRFWAKVARHEGDACWPFLGCRQATGYGRVRIDKRSEYAHRVAWVYAHGPIPPEMEVCHTCDNPTCVRPSHLFLGTMADNQRDKVLKGRTVNPLTDANKLKTHCPKGHPYAGDNLFVRPKGGRECRECGREEGRRRLAKYRDVINARRREQARLDRQRRAS